MVFNFTVWMLKVQEELFRCLHFLLLLLRSRCSSKSWLQNTRHWYPWDYSKSQARLECVHRNSGARCFLPCESLQGSSSLGKLAGSNYRAINQVSSSYSCTSVMLCKPSSSDLGAQGCMGVSCPWIITLQKSNALKMCQNTAKGF